ncbi:MAG: polyphosphate kinase 1 [Verrucomicrobiales bacterium]|nr:polyphosphate kinase 1 [Verrucomicrobiales bacterium]
MDFPFRSKETSWLSFNARVLQEGADPEVPLFERIKFLGIYSNNLDEFFRVRVATLKRLISLGDKWKELHMPDPAVTLKKVNALVAKQAAEFNVAYEQVFVDLEKEGIRLIDETEVPPDLDPFLRKYFREEVNPHIYPIILKASANLPRLADLPMYLSVKMNKNRGRGMHALIEIPGNLPRFIPLPKKGDTQLVMYLDDIIRFALPEIFHSFTFDEFESYAIKFTRDAELAFDDDFTESFFDRLSDSIKARDVGSPVRANFDASIPNPFLNLLLRKLDLTGSDSLYPGARYHNRRDLLSFPRFGRDDLLNKKSELVPVKGLKKQGVRGLFPVLRKRDLLIHTPYHKFDHMIALIQEASIDPRVKKIQMTQYRLAKNSCVARALQSAARNGKEVTVLVEPQARFDEEANMSWAAKYQDAGVNVILGVQGLKVHTKILSIERLEAGEIHYYSILGTGNFNEDTARIFADHMLFTYNQVIGRDVSAMFQFFEKPYFPPKLTHLHASPLGLRTFLRTKIEREMALAAEGKPAEISIKLNNLSDVETIQLINEAAEAGVKFRLIVRSMFSLVSGSKENIESISIVDKYLEHSRIIIFGNDGKPEVYLSSADFLPRNFDSRVETMFPILDKKLSKQLITYFEIQWSDTVKARILDEKLTNQFKSGGSESEKIRSQFAIEEYLRSLTQS